MAQKSEADVQSEAMRLPKSVEPSIERNEFASSQFVDPEARLPRIQGLHFRLFCSMASNPSNLRKTNDWQLLFFTGDIDLSAVSRYG